MTVRLTVRVLWARWGRSTGVYVGPGVVPTFGPFVHRGAHTVDV
jgi:hypothetical protein